jgi:hypothetical protein
MSIICRLCSFDRLAFISFHAMVLLVFFFSSPLMMVLFVPFFSSLYCLCYVMRFQICCLFLICGCRLGTLREQESQGRGLIRPPALPPPPIPRLKSRHMRTQIKQSAFDAEEFALYRKYQVWILCKPLPSIYKLLAFCNALYWIYDIFSRSLCHKLERFIH